jgi:tellurite resistance protein
MAHFASPLATAALAMVYQFAALTDRRDIPDEVWQTLAIIAAVHFGVFGLMYLVKLVRGPRKVYKEYFHPVKGIGFMLPLITLQVFAFLVKDESIRFARALFWIAAPLQALLTLIKIGDGITRAVHQNFLHPGWLIYPLANMVSAMVLVTVYDNDLDRFNFLASVQTWEYEAAWLWFSGAFILFLAIWPLTFNQTLLSANVDHQLRPLMWIYVASPPIIGLSYGTITRSFDNFVRVMVLAGGVLFSLLVLTIRHRMFVTPKYNLNQWFVCFPVSVLTLAAIYYDAFLQYEMTRVVSLILILISTYLVIVNALHTLAGAAKKELWRTEERAGPLSFMTTTHEAFHAATARLVSVTENLSSDNKASAALLKDCLDGIVNAHEVHSRHEDKVTMPYFNMWFPGVGQHQVDDDHVGERKQLKGLQAAANALVSGGEVQGRQGSGGFEYDADGEESVAASGAELVQYLQANVPTIGKKLLAHLVLEEHMYPAITQKYTPWAEMVRMNQECWDITPPDQLAAFIVWAVRTLPIPQWRSAFVKSWYASSPGRAQLVGMMLYRGVEGWMWAALADEMPEIVPRNVPGWRPYL